MMKINEYYQLDEDASVEIYLTLDGASSKLEVYADDSYLTEKEELFYKGNEDDIEELYELAKDRYSQISEYLEELKRDWDAERYEDHMISQYRD